MEHSITFIDEQDNQVNTYNDWLLIPTVMPAVAPPVPKTKYVDIPGFDSHIDMSEALTGYPVYENRQGSFTFIIMNDYNTEEPVYDWYDLYSKVLAFLHGKTIKMILEDEPQYYYVGRFSVNKWDSKDHNSEITIDYNVKPYKYSIISSTDDWLWDPFDFEEDYISDDIFGNITVNAADFTEYTIEHSELVFDNAPICPVFNVTSVTTTMYVRFVNVRMGIDATYPLVEGNNQFPDVIMTKSEWHLYFKGAGILALEFRNGRL